MAKNHPSGLIVLALSNMGERFGYYTMIAILTLYIQAKFGLGSGATSQIYSIFLALIYLLPVLGGIVADKWLGYGKTVLMGIVIMFVGYGILGLPVGNGNAGLVFMLLSLLIISIGTGFFKGNLQALVGRLYDDPRFSKNRDIAFSIFYMFINIGAFFAPSMGNYITNSFLGKEGYVYDASIPSNYNKLNDTVITPEAFLTRVQTANADKWVNLSAEEQTKLVTDEKKKQGVMYPEEEASVLLNLKLAALNQLTKNGKIAADDPAAVSDADYALMSSRLPEDAAKQEEIKTRVLAATPDASLIPETGEGDFSRNFGKHYVTTTLTKSYSTAFFVACISLIISTLIFLIFRRTWKYADVTAAQAAKAATAGGTQLVEMSKEEERKRLLALGLVFVVVIFFWMAFHQNGLTMTFFARDYTVNKVDAMGYIPFSLFMLLSFICFVYGVLTALFGVLGSQKNPIVGGVLAILGIIGIGVGYTVDIKSIGEGLVNITPQIFQQFNPLFIILLTPVTVGIFTYLARKGKEPSAPRKIGIGMILAALGFLVLLIGSLNLPAPGTLGGNPSHTLVSPYWLISTYFVLTIAELFLSPMGLSFVSKVAPPKYSGLMQGGWLAATAVGNYLVGIMGSFWEKLPLYAFWGILIVCCLISAVFIFSIMKKLEEVAK